MENPIKRIEDLAAHLLQEIENLLGVNHVTMPQVKGGLTDIVGTVSRVAPTVSTTELTANNTNTTTTTVVPETILDPAPALSTGAPAENPSAVPAETEGTVFEPASSNSETVVPVESSAENTQS